MAVVNEESVHELLGILKSRFERHPARHEGLAWEAVLARIEARPDVMRSLSEMEKTGGEPDVVVFGRPDSVLAFCDCSAETPSGRRSLCYDEEALESRKDAKPSGSVTGLAASMGIELMTEVQYRMLQESGSFDGKTSSWIKTPQDVRMLGGALFCDRRYGRVFVYHNSAPSWYSSRGFRGILRL